MPAGSTLYGCRDCNWDLCALCYRLPAGDVLLAASKTATSPLEAFDMVPPPSKRRKVVVQSVARKAQHAAVEFIARKAPEALVESVKASDPVVMKIARMALDQLRGRTIQSVADFQFNRVAKLVLGYSANTKPGAWRSTAEAAWKLVSEKWKEHEEEGQKGEELAKGKDVENGDYILCSKCSADTNRKARMEGLCAECYLWEVYDPAWNQKLLSKNFRLLQGAGFLAQCNKDVDFSRADEVIALTEEQIWRVTESQLRSNSHKKELQVANAEDPEEQAMLKKQAK